MNELDGRINEIFIANIDKTQFMLNSDDSEKMEYANLITITKIRIGSMNLVKTKPIWLEVKAYNDWIGYKKHLEEKSNMQNNILIVDKNSGQINQSSFRDGNSQNKPTQIKNKPDNINIILTIIGLVLTAIGIYFAYLQYNK